MLKMVKVLAGAIVLVALALPVVAQQLTVTREGASQAAPKKADLRTKYFVVRGKVLARTDKNGVTRYGYENGRLVRESRQNGLVGTYQYDSGKFTGVVYTDGRYINASYAPNGALLGLTSDTSARVKFNVKSKPRLRTAFAMIQRGIAALRNPSTSNGCIGTDDDNTCTIVIEGETEDEDDDWGDGGTIYIGQNDFPVSGEGGGGGSIASPNNNLPPEECKAQICEAGLKTGTRICAIETNGNPRRMAKCESKNFEFYVKCLKSCENGDWSWMENFNYIWE